MRRWPLWLRVLTMPIRLVAFVGVAVFGILFLMSGEGDAVDDAFKFVMNVGTGNDD